MFKLLFYWCLVTLCYSDFIVPNNLSHMFQLRRQITSLKTHQVTVFTRDTTITKTNNLFGNLTGRTPAVIIDLGKNLYKQSSLAPAISLGRSSNLLIIFQDEFDPTEVKLNLEKFIQLSPIKIRPKCLVLFNDATNNSYAIQSILVYGWSKKFLDLTIVNMNNGIIFSYNPFFNVFNHNSIFSKNIFPNKLINMNKYSVRIPFRNYRPYMFKIKVKEITEYFGMDIDIYKFFESELKFKINFIHNKNFNFITHTLKLAKISEIDLLPGRVSVLFNLPLETGIVVTFHEICAVSANLFQTVLSIIKLVSVASNIILVFSIVHLIHRILVIMKIDSNIFEHIRLLLGQSTNKIPKNSLGKMIVLLFGLFSIIFFPNIVSQLTQVFVNKEEKSISSYKDVLDADLQPYVNFIHNLKLRNDDEFLEAIKSKTIETANENRCLNMAVKQAKVICITSQAKAEIYIKKYEKFDGSPLVRKTDLDFPKSPETFTFAPASPYVEAFDRLTRITFEASWNLKKN